ncbi:MAG: hypothetical protein JXA60_05275 [Candidatus Coatesbacteria bacterium]|nr:hypothetical protein [Candidatus Coatesbacteria bacterium]
MPSIACYISGHGLGHAVRTCEILRCLTEKNNQLKIFIRTDLPLDFFSTSLTFDFKYYKIRTDAGMKQKTPLSFNLGKTLYANIKVEKKYKLLVKNELEFLNKEMIDVVIADCPALPLHIAKMAGIKSIFIGNFTWSWIYAYYAKFSELFKELSERMHEYYSCADLFLRLPFYSKDDFAFNRVIKDIPLVARTSQVSKNDLKTRLGIPLSKKIILLSFSKWEMRKIPISGLSDEYEIIYSSLKPKLNTGFRNITNHELKKMGLYFPDLLHASDIIITKPGFGIVADSIAGRIPMLYTDRGDFPEYQHLVNGIENNLKALYIQQSDLFEGKIPDYIAKLHSMRDVYPVLETDGAEIASEIILSYL